MKIEYPKKLDAKCECGSEACDSPAHSAWCPKHATQLCKHERWIWIDGGQKQCLECADILED
jgi:hypothetical protein